MAGLVVLLGAGASFDCVSGSVAKKLELRPPLVPDLFDVTRPPFAETMATYPLAAMAAAEIRTTLEHEAVALEAYLRERLRDSGDDYARRRYRQIPLYLQDLFHRISRPARPDDYGVLFGYTQQPDHYDVLLNLTLPLERVVFITLNYDTLLDQRIGSYYGSYEGGFRSVDDYVDPARNWLLAKLHGSINWAREIECPEREQTALHLQVPGYVQFINGLDELELRSSIVLRASASLDQMRSDGSQAVYYPALSAPLGAEDEISCPESHVEQLKRVLHDMGELNLLVIGYSGLDQEVLKLLRDSAYGVRRLLVANGDASASLAAAEKLQAAWGVQGGVSAHAVFDGGFGELVTSGQLREFVQSLE